MTGGDARASTLSSCCLEGFMRCLRSRQAVGDSSWQPTPYGVHAAYRIACAAIAQPCMRGQRSGFRYNTLKRRCQRPQSCTRARRDAPAPDARGITPILRKLGCRSHTDAFHDRVRPLLGRRTGHTGRLPSRVRRSVRPGGGTQCAAATTTNSIDDCAAPLRGPSLGIVAFVR